MRSAFLRSASLIPACLAAALTAVGCATVPSSEPTHPPIQYQIPDVSPDVAQKRGLIVLKRNGLSLGIWREAGGRAVYLSPDGQTNLLQADPDQWGQPVPEPTAESPWTAYHGHTTWLGPQEHFWTQQDVNPDRRDRSATFPPDPYLVYANYRIIEQSDTRVVLQSPPSPVSGVQLTKTYEMVEFVAGSDLPAVRVTVNALNIRHTPVSWSLWSNTRVRPDAIVITPLPSRGIFRIDHRTHQPLTQRNHPYRIVGRWLTYQNPTEVPEVVDRLRTKAFVDPAFPVIAAGVGRFMFVKHRETELDGPPPPKQSPVEIYLSRHYRRTQAKQQQTPSHLADLVELEMHSSYSTLQPGQRISFTETWVVLKMPESANTPEALIAFYKSRS